ncbi:unnamed protein product [Tetraodon nigroviridis]|uniref:Vacuolar protein sorting-associated protein 16 homolog n=1 Tax=Tetraodon nigroviridis TaxID=99883 RepID=Q4SDF5_TETNG|nr:unnamed protein product [Tetraodon nigroviridis]
MAFITANWNPLGEAFYRKSELYEMCWDLKDGLRECLVAAAPFGGPIALLRKPLRCSPSSRPKLEIYSASGFAITSFPWKSGPLVQLGWTVSDELLCVQEDGSVLIYDLFGSFKRHFSMGQDVVQNQVLEAKVFHSPYGTGLAIVTGSSHFTLATNIEELKLRRLVPVPVHAACLFFLLVSLCHYVCPQVLQGKPLCWAVLVQDRQIKVLLASGPEIYILDDTSCCEVRPPWVSSQAGSIIHMCVSFNFKYLGSFSLTLDTCFTASFDLQNKLSETDTKRLSAPEQMAWCCRLNSQQPSVVLLWDRLLMVAGVCNDTIQFPIDDECVLVREMDGVRILSTRSHELLQEVPLVCQDIFKIASMAPGALLLKAHREYEKSSQKADEYLRELKEQSMLEEAVKQCMGAAQYEYDPQTQKSLLRAASFGKCFLADFSADPFVATCRELRVLNAIRVSSVGLPLTYPQFKHLTLPVLIDRLVYRQLYPLAIKVCHYLKIPDFHGVSRVLRHWAVCKVQQKDLSDEAIAQAVCLKVGDSPGFSYSDIAAKAYECGRSELAIKFCKLQEQETLKDLYNQDDDHQELANYYVSASYREKRIDIRLSLLQSAVDEYNKAKNDFAAKATEDEMRLLRFQRKLDEEKGAGLLGGSLQATMEALLALGLHKQAEQLFRDFKVPEKRYWWLKLKSLAEKEEWEELEKFSKTKKSPIGYLPFVEVCMKSNNKYEAKKYVSRVTPEQKVRAHLAISDLEGAADAAIERRTESEIGVVLSRCSASDRLLIDRLNRARSSAVKK